MVTPTPPVAVCTECGNTTYQGDRINQRCGRTIDRKHCKGVYGSALAKGDWARCAACDGSGTQTSGLSCAACHGTGWSYVRR
jgi:hypothetical protein